jgi:2-hydroxy-6-oxonona-2,4-dienedioate hydrolase
MTANDPFNRAPQNMKMTRRQFLGTASTLALTAGSGCKQLAPKRGSVIPLTEGPEVEHFRQVEERLLAKHSVAARSRFVHLHNPDLTARVLEAGTGEPLVLIHGGGGCRAQFAPLMGRLQQSARCYSPDRPGCGLSDKIDYVGIPFRQHVVSCMNGFLDELQLPKAAIAGCSMGGYWGLVFALAAPERVTKLVLLGGAAGSPPPPLHRLGNAAEPTLENAKGLYHALMANGDRVSSEMLELEVARGAVPGASLGWNSMLEQLFRERVGQTGLTFALRPELKSLKHPTLFIWGDKDVEGPPTLGQEMASLAPHATCTIVPDAGHLIWLDQPDRCVNLMIEFLKPS